MHDHLADERARAEALSRRFLQGGLSRRAFLRRAATFSAAVAATTSLGALVAACGTTSTPSGGAGASASPGGGASPKAGGTLKGALTGEPDTLDPATSTIYTGAQVYDNIFSKLIDLDENNKFYGVLATKWTQPDATTWVFDLVEGAKFHNGEAFTAEDVKYTFERILNPDTASAYTPLYDVIDSIEATTPTQVTFKLKSSFGPFLNNLANNGEIVNKKAVEAADPARNPVGTGPFKFVEWVQGDHVTLEKNPDYFIAGQPYLDGIQFRFLLVDQSRIEGLRSGELDWVDAVPLQQLATLKADPAFTYVTNPTAGIPDYLAFNTTKAPFDNKALRTAVAWAVDRTQIRDVAYFGAGEVGSEEVPSGSPWFGGGDPYKDGPNLDKARAALADGGITTPLTIHYLGLPQYPELLKTGEVVRDNLKEIGITMEIEQVDVSVWFDRFVKGEYEITSAYQERTIDPDNFYALVLRSGGSINTSGYANPEFDKLVDDARKETDEAKRKEMYVAIRQIAFEDVPILFAHYETINYLMRKAVNGSTVNPTLELRMGNVWLDG
ncbi:MAG TPA: ABC transporter substrate-binding protein [Candidatus Limnocylindrales bacterium]|nr:ABC transporter substrate-binding protein [Candidatus Limnocylindrales bacterium]